MALPLARLLLLLPLAAPVAACAADAEPEGVKGGEGALESEDMADAFRVLSARCAAFEKTLTTKTEYAFWDPKADEAKKSKFPDYCARSAHGTVTSGATATSLHGYSWQCTPDEKLTYTGSLPKGCQFSPRIELPGRTGCRALNWYYCGCTADKSGKVACAVEDDN